MADRFQERRLRIVISTILLAASLVLAGRASSLELITETEAKLPPALSTTTRGGITRGPGIVVVAPGSDRDVTAPFPMKVNFQPHGGSKIDAAKVKVIYLKSPAVDLTPRLKAAISESGIDLAGANAPPGTHDIRIEVTDDAGRTKSTVASFTVVK